MEQLKEYILAVLINDPLNARELRSEISSNYSAEEIKDACISLREEGRIELVQGDSTHPTNKIQIKGGTT